MQKLSISKLSQMVKTRREDLNITQEQLSKLTGINRLMIGRIEREEYIPSFPQMESLSKELEFAITDLIEDTVQEDVFLAARGQAREEEKEAIEILFSMILCIKQQIVLGSKLRNEQRI